MTVVPLSHRYVDAAWPVAAFNVMSKPGGAACNMACQYCFYRHHPQGQDINLVSEGALERFICDYLQSQDNPSVFFTWQGGEPTLVGLDFFRKVIALQQKFARPAGPKIANSLQTNGR